jgi:hypothetical protein
VYQKNGSGVVLKTLIIAIVVDVYYRRHCFFATGKSERFVSFIRRIKTLFVLEWPTDHRRGGKQSTNVIEDGAC